jgi:hypothetical protein
MQLNADRSQSYANQSNDRTASYQSVPVSEAARILGISPEAARARIQRGTLPKEKGSYGTVYVRLDADQMRSYGDRSEDTTADESGDQTRFVASLEEQVSLLRAELVTRNEELRRKDHIIAALTERIPELPAPASSSQEAPGAPETVSEGAGRSGYPRNPRKARTSRSPQSAAPGGASSSGWSEPGGRVL